MRPQSPSVRNSRVILALVLISLLFPLGRVSAQVPTLEYYVTDNVGVLTSSDVTQIEDVVVNLENATTAEIAVLIVNTTAPLTIDEYAVQTFQASGIGEAGKDNGVLLVIAVNDQHWRIEVGYGLEGVLNDAKVGNIGRTYLVPALQSGDYGTGVYAAVVAMAQAIMGEGTFSRENYLIPGVPLNNYELIVAIVIFVVLLIITKGRILFWVGGFFRRFGGGKSGGGGAEGKW